MNTKQEKGLCAVNNGSGSVFRMWYNRWRQWTKNVRGFPANPGFLYALSLSKKGLCECRKTSLRAPESQLFVRRLLIRRSLRYFETSNCNRIGRYQLWNRVNALEHRRIARLPNWYERHFICARVRTFLGTKLGYRRCNSSKQNFKIFEYPP